MKCPKCHYLSFEPKPRCRNCGYDFLDELSEVEKAAEPVAASVAADLESQPPNFARTGAPAVFNVVRPAAAEKHPAPAAVAVATAPPDLALKPAAAPTQSRVATAELPLFIKGVPEPTPDLDEPVLRVPTAPRPLGVRRRAPDSDRARAVAADAPRVLGPFDRDLLEDLQRIEAEATNHAESFQFANEAAAEPGRVHFSLALVRCEAAALDLALMAGLSAAVVWLTLRQCDLTLAQAAVLPIAPLAAFLLFLNVGYLLLFTVASGQTIGKMLFGLRVISEDEQAEAPHMRVRHAVSRAFLTVPSVLMLGAGFIPALFGRGLALHDRLSHTRVIRA